MTSGKAQGAASSEKTRDKSRRAHSFEQEYSDIIAQAQPQSLCCLLCSCGARKTRNVLCSNKDLKKWSPEGAQTSAQSWLFLEQCNLHAQLQLENSWLDWLPYCLALPGPT